MQQCSLWMSVRDILLSTVSWLQSGPQSVVSAGCNGSAWFKLFQVFSDIIVTSAPVSTLNFIFFLAIPYFDFPYVTIGILHCTEILNILILLYIINKWLFCCGWNRSNGVWKALRPEVAMPITSIASCIFCWTCLSRVRFSTTPMAFVKLRLGYCGGIAGKFILVLDCFFLYSLLSLFNLRL